MGQYPILIFAVYIFVGIGVGRLELESRDVQRRILLVGLVLAIISFAGGQFVKAVVGVPAIFYPAAMPDRWDLSRMGIMGQQSGNWFEVISGVGVALAVIAGSLLAMPKLKLVLYPITGAGSIALTVYTTHVISMVWIHPTVRTQYQAFCWTITLVLIGATLWRLAFGQKHPLSDCWLDCRNNRNDSEVIHLARDIAVNLVPSVGIYRVAVMLSHRHRRKQKHPTQ